MSESFSSENRTSLLLQRLHAEAHACADRGQLERALVYTDDGLEVAMNLRNRPFFVDLLKLRGSVHLSAQQFGEAADDYADLTETLHEAADELRSQHAASAAVVASEARMLIQRASIVLYMNGPDITDTLLDRAQRLLSPDLLAESDTVAPDRDFLMTLIRYVRSIHALMRGDAEAAWKPALDAAYEFAIAGDLANAARAEMHVMNALIAYARMLPEGSMAFNIARLAQSHFHLAVRHACDTEDQGAFNLALLADTRVTRMLKPAHDRMEVIQTILRHAQRNHDLMLLTQAYIALADEWHFQGQVESALGCYRAALTVASETDFPLFALPAQQAINRYKHSDDV